MRFIRIFPAFVFGALLFAADTARACPFCTAQQVTFTEEIKQNDVAVVAKLVSRPERGERAIERADGDLVVPKASFEVVETLKGGKLAVPTGKFKAVYFGDAKIGTNFLVMGLGTGALEWGTPIEVSDRARTYLAHVMKLPEARDPERMMFFQQHLEDADPLIARDSYDEFATTPYADLKKMKSRIKHDMLISRLTKTGKEASDASHRRLYFTLLGICGTAADVPILEKMLKNDDAATTDVTKKDESRDMKAGLDALIACYLTLKGPDGLTLIADEYISNRNVEFTDQYQSLMALRFVAEEGIVPKEKVANVFRLMLKQPKYADQIIPDLARWQDWSVVDRIHELFVKADNESIWVRQPAVKYMEACPLPRAKEYLAEFEKLDPDEVKRARGFFSIEAPKTSPVGEEPNPAAKRPAAETKKAGEANPSPANSALLNPPVPLTDVVSSDSTDAKAIRPRIEAMPAPSLSVDTSTGIKKSTPIPVTTPGDAANAMPSEDKPLDVMMMIGLPFIVGLVVAGSVLMLTRSS